MVNRYFNPTPYEGSLYAPPVDFIAGALEKLQGVYDKNFADAQALKDTYLQALPQDRQKADQFQNDVITSIDNITAKYSGDYSQATKDLIALQTDIKRKLRPGTEYYTIQQNFKTYNESLAKEKERLAKGEISQEQYAALVSNIEKNYKGVQKNQVTGTYDPLVIEPLAQYADRNKIATEVLDKLKPREQKVAEWIRDPKSGMYRKVERTISQIDPTEAAFAVKSALQNDDKFMAYLQQLNRLQGTDATADFNAILTNIATELVPAKTGVFKDLQDQDLREDPVARDARAFRRAVQLEELRYQNKIRFEGFKQQQNSPVDGGDVEILGLTKQPMSYPKLDPDAARRAVASPDGTRYRWTNPSDVNEILKLRMRTDVNYELLESIKKANPNKSSKDIIQIYNDNLGKDNSSTELYYTRYQTTAAQKEEAERIVPQLRAGNIPIFEYDPSTEEVKDLSGNAKAREDVIGAMYDNAQKPTKVTARALGKTSVASGDLPFGTIISPQGTNKTYIVADMSTKFNDFNFGKTGSRKDSRSYKLFGWQKDGNQGPPVDYTWTLPDGSKKTYTIMGVKDYTYDPDLRQAIPSTYYVPALKGPGGSVVPDKSSPFTMTDENGNTRLITPFDLERGEITPDMIYARSPHRPRSASKDENIPMESFNYARYNRT